MEISFILFLPFLVPIGLVFGSYRTRYWATPPPSQTKIDAQVLILSPLDKETPPQSPLTLPPIPWDNWAPSFWQPLC